MKLIVFAICAITNVGADVSHLTGQGYHYDKPSTVFEVPYQASSEQQHFPQPSNNYLSPQSQYTHTTSAPALGPTSAQFPHQGLGPSVQGPTSEYLPPQQEYSSPNPYPLHHHEISKSIATSQPEYATALSPATVYHQQISQPIQPPSSEYLPPQLQYNGPAVAQNQHEGTSQSFATSQPYYSDPVATPAQHQNIPQGIAVNQPQYLAPAATPTNNHQRPQVSQQISTPNNEYLPPPSAPAQQAHLYHQDNSQPITAPVSEYLPPQRHFATPAQVVTPSDYHQQQQLSPQSLTPIQQHHEVSQPIATPSNEYLAPPVQQTPQTITAPVSEYLPPQQQYPISDPMQHQQQLPQPIPTPTIDYLPPNEQEQQHHHHHQNDKPQAQIQADGYHYHVPDKSFHFPQSTLVKLTS